MTFKKNFIIHTGDESNFVSRIRRLTQPIFILLFIYYLFPIRFVFNSYDSVILHSAYSYISHWPLSRYSLPIVKLPFANYYLTEFVFLSNIHRVISLPLDPSSSFHKASLTIVIPRAWNLY